MARAGPLCCCLVALSVGLVVSLEQVVELAPSDDIRWSGVSLLETGEQHKGDAVVHMLHDSDLGQSQNPGVPAEKPLTSANPFADPKEVKVTDGQDATKHEANDPDAPSDENLVKKRTSDYNEQGKEEESEKSTAKAETQEDNKKSEMDMSRSSPLSLAGKSGEDAKCEVKGDGVTVSGHDASCNFMSTMIIKSETAVEIAFDIEFDNPTEEGARQGGIFYGASQSGDSRAENPVVEWIDKMPGKGYRIYGNKDLNKLSGMTPGPNPNKRWRITIEPDRTASFSAGPKTWARNYTPLMKGPYFGFFTVGGKLKVTNLSVRKAPHHEKAEKEPTTQGLKIKAEEGYGDGEAELFYSESGGNLGAIQPKTVYLKGSNQDPKDLRTEVRRPGEIGGDVHADQKLGTGRFLEFQARDGYGPDAVNAGFRDSTRMFYIQEGKGRLKGNSVYLAQGNLETEHGSLAAKKDIVAGKQMLLGAIEGNGKKGDAADAEFWYAQIGDEEQKITANTLHLRKGHFATQQGSVVAGDSVVANEYLVLKGDKSVGGEAKFWFSAVGMERFESNTVYLKNGNLATFAGDIMSKGDMIVNRNINIRARKFFGNGAVKLSYVAEGSGDFKSDSMYISSNLAAEDGSIESKKDMVAKRYVMIGTGGAKSTQGGANLWYCHRAISLGQQTSFNDKSLYLKSGDFRTGVGSIYAEKHLVATRELFVGSSGDAYAKAKFARARLWYAHRDSGDVVGRTLYLRTGSFATETGDISTPGNLVAKKYVEILPLEGFGSAVISRAQLFYSSRQVGGSTASELFLKKGDFRLEAGSIFSNDMTANTNLKINAMEGHGTGSASLFYVDAPFGAQPFAPKTLYVKDKVDFHMRNARSAEDLVAKQAVKIDAMKGFGTGSAELWFGKKGGQGGALNEKDFADHVYVGDGDFTTQKGDLAAKLDVETVTGSLIIHTKESAGQVKATKPEQAELWYSSTGSTPQIGSKTLYLRKGDFATSTGSIGASKNIRAHAQLGTLRAAKLQLKDSLTCDTCEFGKIYVLPHKRHRTNAKSPVQRVRMEKEPDSKSAVKVPPAAMRSALDEAMVLLDESSSSTRKTAAIDLETALRKLAERHHGLRQEESHLVNMLGEAQRRLSSLERVMRAGA